MELGGGILIEGGPEGPETAEAPTFWKVGWFSAELKGQGKGALLIPGQDIQPCPQSLILSTRPPWQNPWGEREVMDKGPSGKVLRRELGARS